MTRRELPEDDDELVELLGRAIALDGPSASMVAQAARVALEMRDLDAELADLLFDSDRELETSSTRGVDDFRILRFSTGSTDIELEFAIDGRSARGRVAPTDAVTLLHDAKGEAPVITDDLGRFSLDLGPGRLRFAVTLSSGRRVVTPWIFR